MTIYHHFRNDERHIVDYFMDLKRQVSENYYPKLSRFLAPREIIIAKSILGQSKDILYAYDGGYQQAERTRLFIYPSYYEQTKEDFELVLYQIHYAEKFNDIHHRQVLGSLMSLGIKREMIGDILINDKTVQFITTHMMGDYIKQNLTRVGKTKIKLERLPLNQAIVPAELWEDMSLTVSNLRLDAVIASVLNLSRNKAQTLVDRERVKLNHAICTETSKQLEEGDLISIQGFGRCQLTLIGSRTRKDKIRIDISKIIKK